MFTFLLIERVIVIYKPRNSRFSHLPRSILSFFNHHPPHYPSKNHRPLLKTGLMYPVSLCPEVGCLLLPVQNDWSISWTLFLFQGWSPQGLWRDVSGRTKDVPEGTWSLSHSGIKRLVDCLPTSLTKSLVPALATSTQEVHRSWWDEASWRTNLDRKHISLSALV